LLSALATLAGATLVLMVILGFNFVPNTTPVADQTIREIGLALVSYQRDGFALPFEVISILLLAAMIGAIVVAKKEKLILPGKKEMIENSENKSEQ
jgi:NADH-quinone oxidoreductase subunit J